MICLRTATLGRLYDTNGKGVRVVLPIAHPEVFDRLKLLLHLNTKRRKLTI